MATAGFLSRYLNGPLPYVRRHKSVIKNVLSASLNKTFPFFLPFILQPPENADKASLNDHNIEDVEDIVDASEPVQEIQHPRKNRSGSIFTDQPIIVEGKTFDGIGFNEGKILNFNTCI